MTSTGRRRGLGRSVLGAVVAGAVLLVLAAPAAIAQTATSLTVALTTSALYGQSVTATATVADAVPGTVQFAVDGTNLGDPVAVGTDGTATSPAFAVFPDVELTASFEPTDDTFDSSEASRTLAVDSTATTTEVSVTATTITATVTPVAPGAGPAVGYVDFFLDGYSITGAYLRNGSATIDYRVPTDHAHDVSAFYLGSNGDLKLSYTTYTRDNPSIDATVASSRPRAASGWYRAPVTVRFACAATSAPLDDDGCAPDRVVATEGARQFVTGSVSATDGGSATARQVVYLDATRPVVRIRGVRDGEVYAHRKTVRCRASDALSGLAGPCVLHQRRVDRAHGFVIRYRARAVDEAGNRRVVSGHYRVR
ncbi:Ig-like domain-containing protein [Nocardioides acrostichi]|uniref:Ig-like domain repeat protein n=1 Tax=Nocardioides acrostichi TaxID=2784339 RepID=A0A930V3V8_9ACTN|nr:Ig-like domain-containing protein [Nocardioides acrostichi]MBF4163337.1 Ig-like domain repeat protein [Nocardioides acrostichi]